MDMVTKDFTTSTAVDQAPADVFNAINNVRGWWSEQVEGPTDTLGGEFRYHYKDVHQCLIKVIELVPGQRIVWQVMDNYFNFTNDKSEWKDTKICFEISRKGDQTEIRFTHFGLAPEYECFDICKDAWTHYIKDSLRGLITTGKGEPNPKEGGFNEWLLGQHAENLGQLKSK
jgi:hypothetical protein